VREGVEQPEQSTRVLQPLVEREHRRVGAAAARAAARAAAGRTVRHDLGGGERDLCLGLGYGLGLG
jgi:hypothetical protein